MLVLHDVPTMSVHHGKDVIHGQSAARPLLMGHAALCMQHLDGLVSDPILYLGWTRDPSIDDHLSPWLKE